MLNHSLKRYKVPKTFNMINYAKAANNKVAKAELKADESKQKAPNRGIKGGAGWDSGGIVEISAAPLELNLIISDNDRSRSG